MLSTQTDRKKVKKLLQPETYANTSTSRWQVCCCFPQGVSPGEISTQIPTGSENVPFLKATIGASRRHVSLDEWSAVTWWLRGGPTSCNVVPVTRWMRGGPTSRHIVLTNLPCHIGETLGMTFGSLHARNVVWICERRGRVPPCSTCFEVFLCVALNIH